MTSRQFTTILDELGDSRITYYYGGARSQSVFVNDDDMGIFIWHYITEKITPLTHLKEFENTPIETKEDVALAIKKIRTLRKLDQIKWDFEE